MYYNSIDEQYIHLEEKTISDFNTQITVLEYCLDKNTGIGMIRYSMPLDIYNLYKGNYSPFFDPEYLRGFKLDYEVSDDKNIYFYYSFTLNEKGVEQKYFKIYFKDTSKNLYYNLYFTCNNERVIKTTELSGQIILSPFGITATYLHDDEEMKSTLRELGNNQFYSKIKESRNSHHYSIYAFKKSLTIETISDVSSLLSVLQTMEGEQNE